MKCWGYNADGQVMLFGVVALRGLLLCDAGSGDWGAYALFS
jgi:hypothetical protein